MPLPSINEPILKILPKFATFPLWKETEALERQTLTQSAAAISQTCDITGK